MSKEKEIKKFEQRFSDEVIEIVAVTGPSGVGGGKAGGDTLWRASIDLVAWREIDSSDVIQEEKRLEWLADDQQLDESREWLDKDSIVKLAVRRGENSFMLVEVLSGSFHDKELEALRDEMQKPVYYNDEKLGTFTLDRSVQTFEKSIVWAKEEGKLYFDHDEPEEMTAALATAHMLFEDELKWSDSIRSYAAEELLDLANDWLADDEEAELDEITKEIFISKLELSSISVSANGDFTIYFYDGDMFWGHVIIVEGNINGTFDSAYIAG
jgi:hypothetical protein